MSFGIAVIVIAVVALFLANFQAQTYSSTVAGVIWNGSAGNTTLLVEGGIGSYTVYNDSSEGLTLTEGTHFSLDQTTGLLYVYSNQTSTNMCNYTYSATTNTTYVVIKGLSAMTTFADWFVVIVIVIVSVIILGIVLLLQKLGGGKA